MSKKVLAVAGVITALLTAAAVFDPAHAAAFTAVAGAITTFLNPFTSKA